MSLWVAILLGLVQGVTEFLPVSSRGHLALAQHLIPGFSQPGLVFDVALHVGTVAAVLALEWRRIVEAVRERFAIALGAQLVVATLVTAAIAVPFRHWAEASVEDLLVVAGGFAITALLLVYSRGKGGDAGPRATGFRRAALVGAAQGVVALIPGMSRSGSTVIAGLGLGMERRWAADFSFLLSVPTILAAALVEGWSYRAQIGAAPGAVLAPALVGAMVAAVTGFGALVLVRRFVQQGRLHLFAIYMAPLALVTAALTLAGAW